MFGSVQWELGRAGEQQVRDWLQHLGFGIICLNNIADAGAPSLSRDDRQIVLPDFQVAGSGFTRYAEIKTKSEATFHRNTKTWEHGLELRLWQQYLLIGKQTGLEVWLCVFEVRRNLVLLQNTEHLVRVGREYSGPNAPKHESFVYFPCDEFDWYSGPSDLRVKAITPRAPRTVQQPAPPESQGPTQRDLPWK